MKIGAIGPETTLGVIRKVLERDFPELQVRYCYLEFFEESAEAADRLQRQHAVDAILFSGPTNYNYSLRRVAPTVPWGYLPHSHAAALQAALQAIAVYGSDLKGVSIDRYDAQFLRSALEAAGVKGTEIHRAPYDPEEPEFEKKLLEFHRDCYRRGLVTACFTSMEHIMPILLNEGIPCVRTYPVEGVVREEVYRLQVQDFAARENRGQLAVVAIQYDYTFDSERDLPLREWEKMRYKNEFRERVYATAQRMDGAVFDDGTREFYLAASRSTLINVFLKGGEYWNLVQFGRRAPEYQVWVGVGVGSTMLEAKSRANMALNRSMADQTGRSYMVEDESLEANSLDQEGEDRPRRSESYSRPAGFGPETLERLRAAVEQGKNALTSEELAERMGITVRSANRLIARLEELGYVTTVGRRSAGKGRPARVMKLTLPDVVC